MNEINSHLSTGQREVGGGLERYTFKMALSGILSTAERSQGSRAVMQQLFAGLYVLSPRPDPREIVEFKVTPQGRTAEVELLIQRGHYMLLKLLHEHEDLLFRKDGSIRCSCHPEETWWILRDQLPFYGEEF